MFGACNPGVLASSKHMVSGFIMRTLLSGSVAVCKSKGRAHDFRCVSSLIRKVVHVVTARSRFAKPIGVNGPYRFSVFRLTRGVLRLAYSRSGVVFRPLPRSSPHRHEPSVALTGRGLS